MSVKDKYDKHNDIFYIDMGNGMFKFMVESTLDIKEAKRILRDWAKEYLESYDYEFGLMSIRSRTIYILEVHNEEAVMLIKLCWNTFNID